jgi:16S rRNA (cytosine967-C5)-methyltransferase
MKPGARVGAAIELLESIEQTGMPADRAASGYFRSRRYIGSKDRRAVGDLLFTVLRARRRLDWWLARAGISAPTQREQVLSAIQLSQQSTPEEMAALFCGEAYAPAKFTDREAGLVTALSGAQLDHPEQPDWVRDEVEPWLHERLQARFGAEMAAQMAALGREADVILRVNSLKADPATAREALAGEDVPVLETALSPLALRIEGRRALQATRAFQEGLIEVQDEGSQIIALLCDAQPGMAVADFCAGAGGKTLALAAQMENRGRLVALDLEAARLNRAEPRLQRAGVTIVEKQLLPDAAWLGENFDLFHRVLVDAPCSGSGVWRRQPDARATLTPERLADYLAAQAEVLKGAAPLVRPGGRLIYATCSLLPEEDERQVEAFLARHPEFEVRPVAGIWSAVFPGTPCPADGPYLLLTPATHGTDGFFVAILERRDQTPGPA